MDQDTEQDIRASLSRLERKTDTVCKILHELLRILAPVSGADPSDVASVDTGKPSIMVEIKGRDHSSGP